MPSDARVHYGRKKIKRARAMLRLLREAIGEDAYRRENAALRDVARPLSQVRDAHIAVETLAGLLEGANGALASRVAPLRRQLRDVRIAARRKTLRTSERAKLGRKLRRGKERVEEAVLPLLSEMRMCLLEGRAQLRPGIVGAAG